MSNVQVGDDVKVISGDHEGRAGRVIYMRNVQSGFKEEPYALVEYLDINGRDEISVPVRRLEKK